jgi:allophanate hydrolase
VAERAAAVGDFAAANPAPCTPSPAPSSPAPPRFSATDAFKGLYRLQELRHRTARIWAEVEALAVPSVPCFPTWRRWRPIRSAPNARLGHYTNFVNLLDLAALAVPGPSARTGCRRA